MSSWDESRWWDDPPGGREANAHGVPPYSVDVVATRAVSALGAEPGDYLLDLGCGQGRLLETIRQKYDVGVIGVDSSWGMVKDARARTNAPIYYNNGRSIPDDVPPIHHAYAITLFQHLPHDVTRSYIKQVYLRLPKGGRFLFTHSVGSDPQAFLHHQVDSYIEPMKWAEEVGFHAAGFPAPDMERYDPYLDIELGWSWYLVERKR